MIKPLSKFIVALNGNLGKSQIAAGFSWGLLLGLIPAGNVFWIILFVISFMFRHHHASKLLVMAIIKLISGALMPLVDVAGWGFLHIELLQPFFISLYNMPFVPFTRFNNTLVAGGLVSGIVLWLPVFFLVSFLVSLYRKNLSPLVRDSKLVQSVKKLPLISALVKAVASAADSKSLG